ncbi:MAG: R3H domain-containing nucleic acid-binding protein [Patescibacteria group bacterium]
MEDKIRELLSQFLTQLGYASPYEVTVVFDSENKIYQITINTSDPAILVGYHGDTISSLQLLLSQHLHSATAEWTSVSINVNDYRQRREQALQAMADTIVSRVVSTHQPEALPPLPSNERRVVHVYLTDHPQVTTASQGEGRFRTVVVSPKE